MNVPRVSALFLIALCIMGSAANAAAKDDVGSVIALRGKALIERDLKNIEAKPKDAVLFKDTVSTLESSRAKILFIDDSVLSMAEKSKIIIREFLYSREKGGKSILNLIDGKMKAVVGKANFEVSTPTAVAAARGTVIFVESGIRADGKMVATLTTWEGELFIMSPDPAIKDTVVLTAGMMITIVEGEHFPLPWQASKSEIERQESAVEITGYELSIPGPTEAGAGWFTLAIPLSSPIGNQQPPGSTTPVTIDLIFK
jgi:hypothetical protein